MRAWKLIFKVWTLNGFGYQKLDLGIKFAKQKLLQSSFSHYSHFFISSLILLS
jgi:hypothetical protein